MWQLRHSTGQRVNRSCNRKYISECEDFLCNVSSTNLIRMSRFLVFFFSFSSRLSLSHSETGKIGLICFARFAWSISIINCFVQSSSTKPLFIDWCKNTSKMASVSWLSDRMCQKCSLKYGARVHVCVCMCMFTFWKIL